MGEPLLPYERQQLDLKKNDTEMSPDLEQFMQINQSQQRAAEEANMIFNRDPCSLFGLVNIPIVLLRAVLRRWIFFFSSPRVRAILAFTSRLQVYHDNRDYFILQQNHRGAAPRKRSLWELEEAARSKYADDEDDQDQLEDMEELQEHLEAYIDLEERIEREDREKREAGLRQRKRQATCGKSGTHNRR